MIEIRAEEFFVSLALGWFGVESHRIEPNFSTPSQSGIWIGVDIHGGSPKDPSDLNMSITP